MKHFKEFKIARDNACASLSNAESKLKINAALFRKVGNLKVQNLTLRKTCISNKICNCRSNRDVIEEISHIFIFGYVIISSFC
jgi:hypothetical protein